MAPRQIKIDAKMRVQVVKIEQLLGMGDDGVIKAYRVYNTAVRGEIRRRAPRGTGPHGYTGEDGNPLRRSVRGRVRRSRTTGLIISWVSIRQASGLWLEKGTDPRHHKKGRFTGFIKARPFMFPAAIKFTRLLGPTLGREMDELGRSGRLKAIAYTVTPEKFVWR